MWDVNQVLLFDLEVQIFLKIIEKYVFIIKNSLQFYVKTSNVFVIKK